MFYYKLKIKFVCPGRGVAANILALGASDPGFESQRPDHKKLCNFFIHIKKFVKFQPAIYYGHMKLNLNIKNKSKILIVGGIVLLIVVVFLLTQSIFADSTGNILPSSDGPYLQWTPKTGTTHYTMVDESTCNGTTDYNSTNTVGNRDSYGVSLSSVPNGSTITAIEINPCASRNKTGGSFSTMNVFYRFSGVDSAYAGNYALTGTTPTQLASTTFSGFYL